MRAQQLVLLQAVLPALLLLRQQLRVLLLLQAVLLVLLLPLLELPGHGARQLQRAVAHLLHWHRLPQAWLLRLHAQRERSPPTTPRQHHVQQRQHGHEGVQTWLQPQQQQMMMMAAQQPQRWRPAQ